MADPILVTCGDCGKQIKAPPTAAGKKIRCPKCKAILAVPAANEPVSAGGGDKKKSFDFDREVIEAKNPYGVEEVSLAPRCPHCAHDVDPPDARICLNCGYDMIERDRRASKTVYQRTAGDFIMWHLPTLGCFLGIAALWAGFLYYHYWLPEVVLEKKNADLIAQSRWTYFDDDNADYTGVIFHWGIEVWLIVIALFFSWRLGKFAFIRLFFEFLPPEKSKKQKGEL